MGGAGRLLGSPPLAAMPSAATTSFFRWRPRTEAFAAPRVGPHKTHRPRGKQGGTIWGGGQFWGPKFFRRFMLKKEKNIRGWNPLNLLGLTRLYFTNLEGVGNRAETCQNMATFCPLFLLIIN